MLVRDEAQVVVDATYADAEFQKAKALKTFVAGGTGAAVVRSRDAGGSETGRMVLIGPHFELTSKSMTGPKAKVIAKAVDWAAANGGRG